MSKSPGRRISNTTSRSRGMFCPEFCHQPCPRKQRAQGRPGARRTRGLLCDSCNKMVHTSIQVWRRHPAFPAQWLYGLYVIALVTGFLATIVCFSFRFRQLDASTGTSGPHDFTVRNSSARLRRFRVHRISLHVRDDRDRPSHRVMTGEVKLLICPTGQRKYFCARGWTDFC